MHIKSRIQTILADILCEQISTNHTKDRIANKRILKNILQDNQQCWTAAERFGGYLRILAKDSSNAREIVTRLKRYESDLHIRSINVSESPIDYPFIPKQPRIYQSSVVLTLDPGVQLRNMYQSMKSGYKDLLISSTMGLEHKNEKIVIDFSSPNIAKPFHFGHLKSTILGNYLANINTFLGNDVTRLNYIGDWGTQYGLLSLGIEKYKPDLPSGDSKSQLKKLLDIYVEANLLGRMNESFYDEARRRFKELGEDEGSEHHRKWREIRDLSLNELKKSYEAIGIRFDRYEFESEHAKNSETIVKQLEEKRVARKLQDGMLAAQVERNGRFFEIPILKADGTTLYITRDLSAAISRKQQLGFDRMLYVVGSDQEKHFYCLGNIIKSLGYDWHDQLIHVKMGKVLGMSSRFGSSILLSDIIEEVTQRFIETTKETPTSKVSSPGEIEDVGNTLALSALFIHDMRNHRTNSYEFHWNQVMSNSERSGIHLQTTLARLSSLLKKSSELGLKPVDDVNELNPDAIGCIEAINLLSHMDEFDTEFNASYWSMDPSLLVNYALALCKKVNRARKSDKLWVKGEPNEMWARTRLTIFKAAHNQLELMIRLFGLKPLYRV